MYWCRAKLRKPFLRNSMTNNASWSFNKTRLGKQFNPINELKSSLNNVFFEEKKGENYCAVV